MHCFWFVSILFRFYLHVLFIRKRDLQFSSCPIFVSFCYQGNNTFKINWKLFLPSLFLFQVFVKNWYKFFFKHLVEFSNKAMSPWTLFFVRNYYYCYNYYYYSVSLLQVYSDFSFESDLTVCFFQQFSLHLCYSTCWHMVIGILI